MKITNKDIAQSYIKEDTQKALDKATVLKERLSAFGAEFAAAMRNKQPGQTTYRSKVTGKEIALKYAEPKASKSIDKISPSQYKREREMAKQNMAVSAPNTSAEKPDTTTRKVTLPPVNVGKSTATKSEPELKGRMIPPAESGFSAKAPAPSFVGSKREMRQGAPVPPPGSPPNAPVVSGVRDFSANPPTPSSAPSSDYMAGAERLKRDTAGKNPDDLVPSAARKGREPMNESFATVGSNKYRIV